MGAAAPTPPLVTAAAPRGAVHDFKKNIPFGIDKSFLRWYNTKDKNRSKGEDGAMTAQAIQLYITQSKLLGGIFSPSVFSVIYSF